MIRILSTALITAAVVLLVDVGVTLVHREPVSSLYGAIEQSAARSALSDLEERFPSPADLAAAERAAGDRNAPERREPPPARVAAALADRLDRQLSRGVPIGTLVAPSMDGLETVVLEGIDTSTLRKGPGHYPSTSLPGQPGTVAVAGHRTTYQAPFRAMGEVDPGDRIMLGMPYASFEYTVTGTEIVAPERVDVIEDVGYQQLVLTACHPLYSAAERIVVFARLTSLRLSSP